MFALRWLLAVALSTASLSAQIECDEIVGVGCGPLGATGSTWTCERFPGPHVMGGHYRLSVVPVAGRFRIVQASLVIGFGSPWLPIPPELMFGAQGCQLLANPWVVVPFNSGLYSHRVDVPDVPRLAGLRIYHQAVLTVLDDVTGAVSLALSSGCVVVASRK